ncbi:MULTISPECIES: TetR/AcrR family transcriptional regulator [unclassified Crossiella]|uniref:TetR/AcrR family transcriptional regulator n=1 Tax=unclassified Crossiella TaxID=2620835 RepID=UPI001FFE45FD|nr:MULTISPECIES: TetR/AcrR family transcriptional regulator [unclassified Crossiella]MCK2242722.1 TetR/AcrR family transcriptional regulator [Crossiella sp. S99.2]MCK2256599.1 TetR/AcrR family transcriptional regulator [Crossiella sp. S99.1]
MATRDSYHHGDLRRALLAAAVTAITEQGPAGFSLRELARRAGVSHAAPVHHFGDKAGVCTALAAEGFELLADALTEVAERTGSFSEVGVAYVRFAVGHRAHFEVMFRPELYRADDPAVLAARERANAPLVSGVRSVRRAGPELGEIAAWSLVHGFATLWLTGALPPAVGTDPEAAARVITAILVSGL